MLLLAHTGITLGVTELLRNAVSRSHSRENDGSPANPVEYPAGQKVSAIAGRIDSFTNSLDLRIVLIGSLLPDIIDKPVGQLLFRETFSNGRIFAHTLLFLILITLGGYYLYNSRGRSWLLAFSFGTFTHLILDQMWLEPRTLFWPIFGFTFDRIGLADWLLGILHSLTIEPQLYVPEIVGAAVLLWFAVELVRRREVIYFLKWGRIN